MNRAATHTPARARAALRAALAAACALLVAGAARAQERFRGFEKIVDPRWKFDPDAHQVRGFQAACVPAVRESIEAWESLRREGALVPALRELQQILDDHGTSVLQVAADRYVGAAEYARWLLMRAPADLRAAYSRLAEQLGRAAYQRARADRDLHALRRLARRFANAKVGQEALLTLARLHRERGAAAVAAYHARRVLDFTAVPLPGEEAASAALAAQARALVALASGDASLVLAPEAADAPIELAGVEQPLRALAGSRALPEAAPAQDEWPTYGGDASRARHGSAPRRPLDPDRAFDLQVEHVRWSEGRSPIKEMSHAAIQPIRLGDRLYVNNTLSVKCFDLLSRALVWEHEGAQSLLRGRDEDGFLSVDDFTPRNSNDDPTWSKALIAGLTAGEGVVLANLQVPLAYNVKTHQGFRINDPCPIRGLVALDAESGELLWEQRPLVKNRLTNRLERVEPKRRGDPEGVLARLDVPSPPALVDDVVFALGHFFEGAVNTYVVALELKSGEPLFTVPLATGQQELSMFNMPFQEFTLGCPAFHDGTLYASTNVGLVAAVDAAFGDLRWLKEYDALPIIEPHNYFRNQPRPVHWYNRGALAGADLALFAPHDSRVLFSLDPATGISRWERPLASLETDYPSSQLIGVTAKHVIYASAGRVTGAERGSGRVQWIWPDTTLARSRPIELRGTAALTGDRVWLPTDDELIVLDAADGREVARQAWYTGEAKNLLVFQDLLVAAGQSSVRVAFDPEEALRELRLQATRGESLELLTRIGSLERQSGALEAAAATLARALGLAASATPAELLRARAARCATLLELAARHKRSGDESRYAAALIEAETLADEPQERADVVQELLSEVAPDATDERALGWLARLRDAFPSARVMVAPLAARPIPIGVWVALALAHRHEQRGEFELALAELQRLQSDWPSEPLAAGESALVAQRRVDALFAKGPPSLRERYDGDAEAAFAAAVAAADVERLALLLHRYPSARSAPSYVAEELALLRAARRPLDALAIGAEILRGRAERGLERAALLELAFAAREIGNLPLARALVARLTDRAAPDGAAEPLPAELAELREPVVERSASAGRLEPAATLTLPQNSVLLGGSERPLRGEPLPAGFDAVLALEQGFALTVSRVALPSGEQKWQRALREPRQNKFALSFVHAAGVVVAKRGSLLTGIDLGDGSELWTRELDREIAELAATDGMVLVTLRTPPVAGEAGEPVTLLLVEPRSGTQVASLGCAGTDSRAGQLLASSGVALVTSFGTGGQTVEAFDAVTGARRLDPKPAPVGICPPLLLPTQQLVVVPDTRPVQGEAPARQGGVQRVVGWRLDSGERAYEIDLLPLAYKLKTTYLAAEGLALLGGASPNAGVLLVDPASGTPLGPPNLLAPDVAETFRRLLVLGEEALVRVQGYVDWRKGEPARLELVAGNGVSLWREGLPVPDNTVQIILPDRLQRRGGALLGALQYHAGGRYRTELLVLDEASGRTLSRESFEGGRPGQRDDVVVSGEWVALRQEATLRVLGWR